MQVSSSILQFSELTFKCLQCVLAVCTVSYLAPDLIRTQLFALQRVFFVRLRVADIFELFPQRKHLNPHQPPALDIPLSLISSCSLFVCLFLFVCSNSLCLILFLCHLRFIFLSFSQRCSVCRGRKVADYLHEARAATGHIYIVYSITIYTDNVVPVFFWKHIAIRSAT